MFAAVKIALISPSPTVQSPLRYLKHTPSKTKPPTPTIIPAINGVLFVLEPEEVLVESAVDARQQVSEEPGQS